MEGEALVYIAECGEFSTLNSFGKRQIFGISLTPSGMTALTQILFAWFLLKSYFLLKQSRKFLS